MRAGGAIPGNVPATQVPRRGGRLRAIGRLARRDPPASACVVLLGLVVLAALLAPLLAPYAPDHVDLSSAYLGPSLEHLLGTDAFGRDILSRLLFGARTSLLGALGVVAISAVAGVALALVAAWFGGFADTTISAGIDVLFSFPGLLLAIIAAAVFGAGLGAPVVAFLIPYTPLMARLVRGAAQRERELPHIAASTVLGFSSWRIVLRHLLPNLWPLILAQLTIEFGYATIDIAAISFLGLGVQPPTSDWGLMVAQGRPAILAGHPGEAIYPGIALVLVVLAVMVLGRRLADRSGPRP